MAKCACGLNYVPGEDDKLHDELHQEYLYGPHLPELKDLKAIDSVKEFPLFVVDNSVPNDIRSRLSGVALVAQRETPEYQAGYYGTISDADERLFLVADGQHAIAMVLTAKDKYF